MNDRSIRPSFTPSKVCTAPTGAFGRMLHFTRAAVAFSMSAQNGASMLAVSGCPGDTHELALRITCAAAGADAMSAASPNPSTDITIPFMVSSDVNYVACPRRSTNPGETIWVRSVATPSIEHSTTRSEEHTSELQSQSNLVC